MPKRASDIIYGDFVIRINYIGENNYQYQVYLDGAEDALASPLKAKAKIVRWMEALTEAKAYCDEYGPEDTLYKSFTFRLLGRGQYGYEIRLRGELEHKDERPIHFMKGIQAALTWIDNYWKKQEN